ncbi:hypothetical protein Ct61P_05710 [Colletotrichum tofieldiae]|nr:hypothetical protein Ct61P_05710 [Colletotrichum tofieldiae]
MSFVLAAVFWVAIVRSFIPSVISLVVFNFSGKILALAVVIPCFLDLGVPGLEKLRPGSVLVDLATGLHEILGAGDRNQLSILFLEPDRGM